MDIPHLEVAPVVDAFKMGLKKNFMFYEDLVMTPWKKPDNVRKKALIFIGLVEEKFMQKNITPQNTNKNPNRKFETSSQRFHSQYLIKTREQLNQYTRR